MSRPNPASRKVPVQVSIWPGSDLDDELAPRLDNRGRPHVLKRDLKRYYGHLSLVRRRIASQFEDTMITSAYDALREEVFTPETIRNLGLLLTGHAILHHPAAMLPDELLALADAVEQIRSESWPNLEDTIPERLRRLGLIR